MSDRTPTGQKWEGRWDQLKGRVKAAWGELTDDDLEIAAGNLEELIGRINERTGQNREEIRRRLEELGEKV